MAIHKLAIPGGFEPSSWLEKQAPLAPTIVPTWPDSPRKALVLVVRDGAGRPNVANTEAFVITTRAEMTRVTDAAKSPQLWFSVSKETLKRPGICPALRDEDFET